MNTLSKYTYCYILRNTFLLVLTIKLCLQYKDGMNSKKVKNPGIATDKDYLKVAKI